MTIRRASYAVYDIRYHLVWALKYRKWILRGDIQKFVEDCFKEIVISNVFEIEAMEIAEDHVHIFLGFPLCYSICEVVQRFKGKSARQVFKSTLKLRKNCEEGNFGKMDILSEQ